MDGAVLHAPAVLECLCGGRGLGSGVLFLPIPAHYAPLQLPLRAFVANVSRVRAARPQVRHYGALGWLPTEVAWRRDLLE